jgi:hypothetical protein
VLVLFLFFEGRRGGAAEDARAFSSLPSPPPGNFRPRAFLFIPRRQTPTQTKQKTKRARSHAKQNHKTNPDESALTRAPPARAR